MKKILLSLSLLLTCVAVRAQYFEFGVGLGGSAYSGELASYRLEERFKLLINPALQFQLRYNMSRKFSAVVSLWSGSISGADSIATSSTRLRNLNFHSPLTELSLNAEYFPFRRDYDQKLNLYVSAGIGVFRFNPKTYYNNQEIALQPLGTEGQGLAQFPERKPYSLTQFSIPIGGGIQYRVSETIQIQVSMMGAYTRTDYLDDVSSTYIDQDLLENANGSLSAQLSRRNLPNQNGVIGGAAGQQRGSSGVNDYYFSGFVTLLFGFGQGDSGCYAW